MKPFLPDISDPFFVRRIEDAISERAQVLPKYGVTAARPTDVVPGQSFFDSTLGKPIWVSDVSGGTATWVDATGTTV